jgi:hypothetical protein
MGPKPLPHTPSYARSSLQHHTSLQFRDVSSVGLLSRERHWNHHDGMPNIDSLGAYNRRVFSRFSFPNDRKTSMHENRKGWSLAALQLGNASASHSDSVVSVCREEALLARAR